MAAYGTYRDFQAEHHIVPTRQPPGPADEILGAFAWAFVVPGIRLMPSIREAAWGSVWADRGAEELEHAVDSGGIEVGAICRPEVKCRCRLEHIC